MLEDNKYITNEYEYFKYNTDFFLIKKALMNKRYLLYRQKLIEQHAQGFIQTVQSLAEVFQLLEIKLNKPCFSLC